MRFWDSSALVTLHVAQSASDATRALYEQDRIVVAWALSDVEMRSALCRLARMGLLDAQAMQDAIARSEAFWRAVRTVHTVGAVRARAKRLLGIHALTAADALQLGAALTAAEDDPAGFDFVCLDRQLGDAARREGFRVLP